MVNDNFHDGAGPHRACTGSSHNQYSCKHAQIAEYIAYSTCTAHAPHMPNCIGPGMVQSTDQLSSSAKLRALPAISQLPTYQLP